MNLLGLIFIIIASAALLTIIGIFLTALAKDRTGLKEKFKSNDFRIRLSNWLTYISEIFYLPCVVLSGEFLPYVFLSLIMIIPLCLLIANWRRYNIFAAIVLLAITLAGTLFFTSFIYLIYNTGGAEFGNMILFVVLSPYVFLITPLVHKAQKKDREISWPNFLLSIFENKITFVFLIIYFISFFFNPPLIQRMFEYQEEKEHAKYAEEREKLKQWDAIEIVNDNLPDSIEFWTSKYCPDSEKNYKYTIPAGYVLLDCLHTEATMVGNIRTGDSMSKIILKKASEVEMEVLIKEETNQEENIILNQNNLVDKIPLNQSSIDEEVALSIIELSKIYNEENLVEKVIFSFSIKNNGQDDIKIPGIQIGKSFIFKNTNVVLLNSKIINNAFREETDGLYIVIKPEETREFSAEFDVSQLKNNIANKIELSAFKYLKKDEIYSINVDYLLFNESKVSEMESLKNSKETIAYILDNIDNLKVITQNGNSFIMNKTKEEMILDYMNSISYAQDMEFYKKRIESLNNDFGSPLGGYPYITYSVEDGVFKDFKIKGLDPQ